MTERKEKALETASGPDSRDLLQDAEILASDHDIEGSSWQLGLWDKLTSESVVEALQQLTRRVDYPNVFFDPAYLKNSSQLVARKPVKYMFLLETYGEVSHLRFFAPVTKETLGPLRPNFFRVWSTEFAPLGQPLVCAEDLSHTTEKLLSLTDRVDPAIACGLLINSLPKNSEFSRNLFKRSTRMDNFTFFNHYERASLIALSEEEYEQKHLSGKRRQRLNAARRKLSALGDVTITCHKRPPEVEVSLLDFLYLEKRGWKGKRNTALASNNDTRQLAMDAIRELSTSGKTEIHNMYLDGNAIASIILLNDNGHYIAWKIAFDEQYANYSVGNLMSVHATAEITQRPGFKLLDSVAIGSNETANSLWPDRLPLCSLSIGFGKKSASYSQQIAFNLSVIMRTKRGLRALFKR